MGDCTQYEAAVIPVMRSDYEYEEAVKIIKVLVKRGVIQKVTHEEDYLRNYQAAFEILDLFK